MRFIFLVTIQNILSVKWLFQKDHRKKGNPLLSYMSVVDVEDMFNRPMTYHRKWFSDTLVYLCTFHIMFQHVCVMELCGTNIR